MSLKAMPLYATFWREFYERPAIVYFMVHPEGEYHFRDVVSLMEISRVFPHGLTQVRFCPVIPGVTPLESPAPGEGIIILGRPEHFRSEFIQERIIDNLCPSLRLSFEGNDPKKRGYRTLRCALTGKDYSAPNGRDGPSQLRLEDYALIYLGQARTYESEDSSPCLILSGTSTRGRGEPRCSLPLHTCFSATLATPHGFRVRSASRCDCRHQAHHFYVPTLPYR